MVKAILVLALLGGLGWFAYEELDLGRPDGPTSPSVQYPHVDGGGGTGDVGEKTGGLLGR